MDPADSLTPSSSRKTAPSKRRASKQPLRFQQFIAYFKKYLALGAVGCGVLPAPLSYFHVIPTFKAQYKFLTGYVTVFCFLALGFIFYSRHSIAHWIFTSARKGGGLSKAMIAWLPLA